MFSLLFLVYLCVSRAVLSSNAEVLESKTKTTEFTSSAPTSPVTSTTAESTSETSTTDTSTTVTSTTDTSTTVTSTTIESTTVSPTSDTSTTVTSTAPTTIVPTTDQPNPIPKFHVKNETSNNICIVLQGNLTLFVPFFTSKEEVHAFTIDKSAVASGQCNESHEFITLSWTPEDSKSPFILTLNFKRLPSSPSVDNAVIVNEINFTYTRSSDTQDKDVHNVSATGVFFKTPSAHGYKCDAQQNISLADGNQTTVQFSAASLKVEAFRNSTTDDFEHEFHDCTSDSTTSNVVPIAVGVCFAILIVLAVVVFLIGNRRRQQGYQSL